MMTGQIVEIPKDSSIYIHEKPLFSSKKEELTWNASQREYSLFDGFLVGGHDGVENFIFGQSKGLNISGKAESVYIIGIDKQDNRLFVGQGKNHPGLFSSIFKFSSNDITWIKDLNLSDEFQLKVICKLFNSDQPAHLYKFGNDIFLEFDTEISIHFRNYLIELFYENEKVATINKY